MKRLLTLMLCLAVLMTPTLAASAASSAKGTTVRLGATEGTVTVANAAGKAQSVIAKMRLYNGYTVSTGAKSSAFITLDDTKAVKLDASSSVKVKKTGSKLEVSLLSGTLVFNVTEPLASNETLTIRTSNTVTGIRGSFGWISDDIVALIHGFVNVTCYSTPSVPLSAPAPIQTFHLRSGYGVQPSVPGSASVESFARFALKNDDVPSLMIRTIEEAPVLQQLIKEDVPSLDVDELIESLPEVEAQEEAALTEKEEELKKAIEEQEAGASGSTYWYDDSTPTTVTPGSGGGSSGDGGGSSSACVVTLPTSANCLVSEVMLNGVETSNSTSVTASVGDVLTFAVSPASDVAGFGASFYVSSTAGTVSTERSGETYYCELTVASSGALTTVNDANLHIIQDADDVAPSLSGTYGNTVILNSSIAASSASSDDPLTLSGLTLYAREDAALTGAPIAAMNGSAIILESGAMFTTDSMTINEGASLTINPTATLSAESLDVMGRASIAEDASLMTSSLICAGNVTNAGSITATAEGFMEITGTFTNSGTVDMESSFINCSGTLTNSGTLTAGSLETEGSVTNAAGASMTLDSLMIGSEAGGEAVILINNGTLACAGSLYLAPGSSFTNGANARCENGGFMSVWGTAENAGLLVNGADAEIYIPQGGALHSTGTLENDGIITYEGTFDNTGKLTGGGTIKGPNDP